MATYKKTAKEKGQLLYEEALKSGRVLSQGVNPLTGKKGTGQAIATPTGLQKITKTNAQGLQVGGTRNAPGAITELTPTSYEDIGKIQQENDYQATLDAAQELGLGEDAPTKMDEYIKMKVEAKKRQDRSQNLALEGQRMDLRSQAGAVSSQSDYGQAMAASGLNGPQTNTALAGGYQQAAQAQLARLKIDDQRLAMYAEDLKAAQASGDLELAQSIQAERDAYTNQAMANEAAYVQALGDYEKTKAAVTQSNLSSFQSLVDEGQELSVEAISGFAGQLGIPFEDAYGYYAGVQSIRDDKTLSLEEKELAIADAKYGLEQKMKGLSTKEAQTVSDYMTLVKSGNYTPDQLQAFAVSMNIPDENNPVYMADLAVKQAEAKIKAAEANGELLSPVDQLDYATKLQEYYDLMDITPGTIPNGGSIETTALPDADGISFQFETGTKISSGKRTLTQCGQFVNDVLGLSMGDSLASKVAFVDKNIVLPEPGMGFVISDGIILSDGTNTGHTGIVEYYNPETQMVGVADVNARGDNLARHHEIPLAEILQDLNAGKGGFVPGKGLSFDQASQASADTISSTVSVLARATDKKDVVARISDLVTSGNKSELRDYVATIAFEDLPAEAQNRELLRANLVAAGDQLKEYVSQYVDAGGDLGIFAGSSLEIQNKLGDLGDADQQKIGQLIRLMLEDFGRAQTGAAIQDFEKKNFKAILPTLFDGKELIDAKIDAFAEAQQVYTHGTLKKKLGETVYNLVYGEDKGSESSEPIDEDALMQEAEEQAKYDSLIDDSDINDLNNL